MALTVPNAVAAFACLVLTFSLQGCGGGGSSTTTTSTTTSSSVSPGPSTSPGPLGPSTSPSGSLTSTSSTPAQPSSWKLEPIEVKGSHLYGSRTGNQFFAKGFAFPNVPSSSVDDWIESLEKIHELAPLINTVRVYEFPSCAMALYDDKTFCSFKAFFQKADELGIYVMVPASGRIWGWFPGKPNACNPPLTNSPNDDLNGCYDSKAGAILGFGRSVVNNFNYPNVLAIVLANEVEQNYQAFPVLKAYARDMKAHMKLCNEDAESPTKGKMRQIPLTYAGTDTGNPSLIDLTDYLVCDSSDSSIDIVGVNMERWVSDSGGNREYKALSDEVGKKQWPAAWIHTEEGGPDPDHKSRTWNQLKDFFSNYPNFDGYYAYSWHSDNADFDMFDGLSTNATMYPDGKSFFEAMSKSGPDPSNTQARTTVTPKCANTLTDKRTNHEYVMIDYNSINIYDTGANGWAKNCPAPWQDMELDSSIVV